jgi:hypothetical protein
MNATLAWILVLVIAGAAGALAYLLLNRRARDTEALPAEWSLTPRSIFSQHERRVYRQLREALPQHAILAKLPLVRFCQPTDPTQVRFWFDLLGAIHVSFAVCSAGGRVLAAIDIDDDGRVPPRRSVQIKKAVLSACHIRYVRYPTEQTPSVPELQLLVPAAPGPQPAPVASPSSAVMRSGPKVVASAAAVARPQTSAALWPDSAYNKDSAFGRDSVISGFSHSLPSVLPDRGGEVVDAPAVRH